VALSASPKREAEHALASRVSLQDNMKRFVINNYSKKELEHDGRTQRLKADKDRWRSLNNGP